MKHFHKKEYKHWITNYGFEEDNKSIDGLPCQYEILMHSNSCRPVWVAVDFNKQLVHIVKELDSLARNVLRETIDVSYTDTEEEYDFMIELDTLVDKYMED